MKAVLKKEKSYYKFVDWEQPTLTSNGTMGVSELACFATRSYNSAQTDCYNAFLPNTGYVSAYKSLSTCTLYIHFQAKNYLLLSNFSFRVPVVNTNNDASGGYARNLTLEGYNKETSSWETLAFIEGGSGMGNKTHTMDLTGNTKFYKYFRFQASCGGGGHADQIDISQIQITAKQAVECEEAEHEFYEDTVKAYLPRKFIKRIYYKYEYSDFVQPTLSGNGTMGGESFAVAQSSVLSSRNFYEAVSGTEHWHSTAGMPQWVSWYNPKPLNVTKLTFGGASDGNILTGIVQACNDNTNWIDLVAFENTERTGAFEIDLSSNVDTYRYYRIYITSCAYASAGKYYALIDKNFKIIATEQTIVEGTEQDHDYYRDEYTYYGITE